MKHKKAKKLLFHNLYGALSAHKKKDLKNHIEKCLACKNETEKLKHLVRSLKLDSNFSPCPHILEQTKKILHSGERIAPKEKKMPGTELIYLRCQQSLAMLQKSLVFPFVLLLIVFTLYLVLPIGNDTNILCKFSTIFFEPTILE